jgi:hypothetical protein
MRLLFVSGTASTSAFLQYGQDRNVRCSLVDFVVIAFEKGLAGTPRLQHC